MVKRGERRRFTMSELLFIGLQSRRGHLKKCTEGVFGRVDKHHLYNLIYHSHVRFLFCSVSMRWLINNQLSCRQRTFSPSLAITQIPPFTILEGEES